MKERITNLDVKDFLMDFEKNSQTMILEEGKEKTDIIEVANAKGINLRKNTDLAGFKTIFTFADKANNNGARLPKKKLLRALPTLIGKPVDIDHARNMVVGHYIDYRFRSKDNAVIAYGVFYKSNFGKEWEQAKKLFKANKLGTSFEIWCPQNRRKELGDGTYELCEMEIAGGGLMFKEQPAFEDALVLEVAKKNIKEMEQELVFASDQKYKSDDLIVSDYWQDSVKEANEKLQSDKADEAQRLEEQRLAEVSVTCENCTTAFEKPLEGDLKCPKCFSLLKNDGSVEFPPQIIDFKVNCPDCKAQNWKLVKQADDNAEVKCMSCAKEYDVKFAKPEKHELLDKMQFVYTTSLSCPQCSTPVGISTVSDATEHEAKCTKCGLQFDVDVAKVDRFKQIEKISEVVEEPENKESSEKGGEEEMKEENKTEEETKTDATEEVKTETKEEVKVEETKTETPKAEEKTEEKAEVKEEVKVEEPKAEETKTEAEAEVVVKSSDATEKKEETPVVSEDSTEASKEEKSIDTPEATQEKSSEIEKDAQAVEPSEEQKEETTLNASDEKENSLRAKLDRAIAKIVELKKDRRLAKASLEDKATLEIAKIKKETEAKIELFKAHAKTIVTRQSELGDYEHGLSDKDILNDDKFANAQLEKENVELKAEIETSSDVVSTKRSKDDAYYSDKKAEIDSKAFPSIKN